MSRTITYAEQCERDDEKRWALLRMEARMNTDPGELFWVSHIVSNLSGSDYGKFHRTLYRHDPIGTTVSVCWATMWSRVLLRMRANESKYGPQSPRRWEDWRPVSHGRITLIPREVQAKIEMLHVHAPGRVEAYLHELCAGDNP